MTEPEKITAGRDLTIKQLEAAAEIERLTTENWQLRQACGYPIPADKETPQNPFKCGTCDAKSIDLVRLRTQRDELLAALKQLDEMFDFTDGFPSCECFLDPTEVNAVCERACAAIAKGGEHV